MALACASAVLADVVELEDGTVLEGELVRESAESVTLVTSKGTRTVLARRRIAAIRKGVLLVDLYREKRAALGGDAGAQGHLALGQWCEKAGLEGLATFEFRRAVALDPALAAAREKLGHRLWEGRWYESEEAEKTARGFGRFRGRWLAGDELATASAGFVEHGGDWFTAEERRRLGEGRPVPLPDEEGWRVYRTLHYRLRTRVTTGRSRRFADTAEKVHDAFRDHFGFAPPGVLKGRIFEDLDAFEDFAVGIGMAMPGALASHGFFGGAEVFCPWVDDDYTSLNILIHELCHQFESLGRPGARVPPWFSEGIACVFGHHAWNGNALEPGRLVPRKNFNLYYLQQIVRTKTQMDLRALLTGHPGARPDPVFYHHAWGLVWFLLHDEKGGYAAKFGAYQAAIFDPANAGRDPVALFTEHFGPLEPVEKDFTDFVLGIEGIPWRGEGKPAGQKR